MQKVQRTPFPFLNKKPQARWNKVDNKNLKFHKHKPFIVKTTDEY